MTEDKDREMIEKAIKYIIELRMKTSDWNEKDMLFYIQSILQVYDTFKTYATEWEKYNGFWPDATMNIKFKTSTAFQRIEECMMYPWPNITSVH